MVRKKSIAIIPARGGSTRIPMKNIMEFNGKPLIAFTIEACIVSKKFDRILVSTDNEIIAKISQEYGVEMRFLRTEYSDDTAPVSKAVLFALNQAEEYYREKYDYVSQLMPNCPIRTSDDIMRIYDNFIIKDYASQITCFKFGFMNPWWALKIDNDNVGTRIFDIAVDIRSQDLEELYCPTGAMWIAKTDHLRKYGSFYGEHRYFEIGWKSAVDIDNYEDVEFAKAVYKMVSSCNSD
jgi:N-acylneuraminate cytidylyltransferase